MTLLQRSDKFEVKIIAHPFKFNNSSDPLVTKVVEAINLMGGVGKNADEHYQAILAELQPEADEVLSMVFAEYNQLQETSYLDRWSLIKLLADLHPKSSLEAFDAILSTPIPSERYEEVHSISSVLEETLIRMNAVDGIVGIALEESENEDAWYVLLKHVQHEDLSIKQMIILSFLLYRGEGSDEILLSKLPEQDHYLLDIEAVEYESIPQPDGKAGLREPDDTPTIDDEIGELPMGYFSVDPPPPDLHDANNQFEGQTFSDTRMADD